jgi:serine/threonine protein kinase
MNEAINPKHNPIGSSPRPWRDATQMIRDAAVSLVTADENSTKNKGKKPLAPTPLERMGLRTIDFGAARLVEADSIVEAVVGAGISSPKYMSPERCRGQRPDARSDVYVLTCRYYELLTGELPFTAADEATLLYEHCYTAFPDAASKVSGLPNGVLQVLARGSEKDPADRYQSAVEMVADLTTLLETSGTSAAGRRLYAEMPVGTAPISHGKTPAKSSFKRKMVYAVLAIAVVGAGSALLKFHEPNPPSPLNSSVAQAPHSAPARCKARPPSIWFTSSLRPQPRKRQFQFPNLQTRRLIFVGWESKTNR